MRHHLNRFRRRVVRWIDATETAKVLRGFHSVICSRGDVHELALPLVLITGLQRSGTSLLGKLSISPTALEKAIEAHGKYPNNVHVIDFNRVAS